MISVRACVASPICSQPDRSLSPRRVFLLVVVFVALVMSAAPASAHASLETTTPANGAELPAGQAPKAVSLKFSENVQIPDNAIRVIGAGRGAVDTGAPKHGTNDSVVVVDLPALPDGTYVVSWRVVSADAHVVSGALSFAVGHSDRPLSTAGASGPGPNRVVGFVFGLDRTIAFLGVLVLIGSVVFRRAMWPVGIANPGVGRLIGVAWCLAFVTSLFGICLQGIAGAGAGLGSLFDPSLISNVLETDYGHALVTRCVLLVVLVPVLWLLARNRRWVVDTAAVVVAVGLLLTFVYAGHAHTGRWVGLAMVTDLVHVGAAAVWLGGLCALAVTFASPNLAAETRDALSRFVMVALPAIALVALSGVVQGLRQVGTVWALVHTGYGRLLLVKVAIVVAILIVANTSRRVATGRILAQSETPPANRNARRKARTADRSAVTALRKAVAVEIAFAVVVLAVTAALVNTQPGRDVRGGEAWAGAPFSEELRAPPLTLAVSVVPGHTGANQVKVTPRSDSNRLTRVVDVDASISQPDAGVAKLSIAFRLQADGSYAGRVNIPLPGIWQLEMSVLRTQFEESRASADLPIGVATGISTAPAKTEGLTAVGVARLVRPFRDTLLAGLARDAQVCQPPTAARFAECRTLLDKMNATAVSLSRTLRTSNPAFSIESTMYFTVDAADEFAAGISNYRATGCADSQSKVPPGLCRQHAQLYRGPASELERNLRGWDQYLRP
jgi:copper transport protein